MPDQRRPPAEELIRRSRIDETGVGEALSERARQRQRSIESYLRGEGEEDPPPRPRRDLARRAGVDMDEAPDLQRDRRLVDAHRPAAADDDVDLFLPGRLLVVLGSREARLEDELVDPERARSQLP